MLKGLKVVLVAFWHVFGLQGVSAAKEFVVGEVAWEVTWDFRERALTPADGKSSVASSVIQTEDKHLVFFGWLGAIQAAKAFGSPYVGFAIVSCDLAQATKVAKPAFLEVEARSDSPGIHFDVLLEDAALQKANLGRGRNAAHLALLKATETWQTYRFAPSDFVVVSRGVELAGEGTLDLEQIRRLGFQVRKSAQQSSVAHATTRTPFHLEVRAVRWLP